MKIGIISDIHSNIQALQAVLKEFDKIGIDKIICCGDIIGIGINPEEVVQELMKRKDVLIAVRGNHEKYLLEGFPERIHDCNRKMQNEEIKAHCWNHNKLSEESIQFLNSLKKSINIEIEGVKIYIIHYPENENGKFKKHIKRPNIVENEEMFKEINADIFLYGHTHTYSVNNKDNKWYINVGSLGCPEKSNLTKAGILEINNKKINFYPINIKYNVQEVIEEIKKIKMPDYKGILKVFYGINLE